MRILIKKDPRYPIDTKKIRIWIKKVLTESGLSDNLELSVVFVGKRKAKQLNQDYRQMDYIPEVLAFPLNEKSPEGTLMMGDLVICFPEARRQAMARDRMVDEIIFELLTHGINNLIVSN
ncbi:MAG: rRNA maturation RNase YbeY [Patescibacteria group bacterium]